MSTNYIDQITDTAGTTHDISEGDSTRIFRANCTTAASTTAKVATLDTSNRNFSLTTGVRVAVTFKYGNSATTPTLRVDGSSTGTAKTIAFSTGSAARSTGNGTTYNTWGPYETVIFTYDGTYWVNSGSALGIYNAYTQAAASGTGTVTSVGITNGGGLSISGSPVTTSGSITVGHSNSVTAQTTQAVYPIKIDAQGHISAYGSAVTIPTDEQVKQDSLNGTNSARNILVTNNGQTTASTTSSVNYARYFTYNDSVPSFTLTNTSDSTKQITISSTTISVQQGSNTTSINFTTPTTNRSITFPNNGGTVALTSDIPTVPTITLNGSSTTSPSFYAPTGAGTSGYVLKSNGSGAPSWTSATLTDENVKSTTVTSATTNYIVGSTSSSTATGGLSKHASALIYTTADSGTSGYTQLRLGNTTATTSAGGKEGQIRLYGTGATYYLELKPGAVSSSNKTITFPNKTGTVALTSDIPDVSGFITSDSDEKVKVAAGSATGTDYYPVLATEAGTATRQYLNTIRFLGDSSYGTQFILGKNDGTQGLIQLWSKTSGYYTSISPENTLTANRGIKLPDKDGTIALTSDIPSITFTQTLTEGTEIGKININGTNTSIYSKDPVLVTKISNTSITATSANTWFYTNQSITVPTGHIYLVQVYVNYSNTKCLGIGMHTASTFSQYYSSPFYHMVSASSSDHLGVASFMLHGGTTWYCWLKYAGANSDTVYIRYLDFPYST